jgi:hypothetical protein
MGRRPSHPRVCAACDVGDNAPVADVGGGLAGSTTRFCAGLLLPPGRNASDVVTGVVTAAIPKRHEGRTVTKSLKLVAFYLIKVVCD